MGKIDDVKSKAMATQTTDIASLIKKSTAELGKALPKHMNAERLVRIALTTLRLNPELYKCTPESLLGALFQSAQLGLEPNVEGQAYLIPFNNKRKVGPGPNDWKTVKEVSFQIGYKGMIELFYRHEKSLSLDMQKVCEGDSFDYALGTDAFIKHKPADKRGDAIGFYAVATLSNGAKLFKYMSKEEALEHGKKFSKCWDKQKNQFYTYTPWNTNPDAMCMKTVLMQLSKLLPKSIEIQKAMAMDETIKVKVDEDMFAVPDKTVWKEDVLDVIPEGTKKQGTPVGDPLEELISENEAKVLKAIIIPIEQAFYKNLQNTWGVETLEKIKKIWLADVMHYAKNHLPV